MKFPLSSTFYGFVLVSFCLLTIESNGQNVPVTPPASTLGVYTPPATYSDPTTVNYVRIWTARAPMTAPAAGDLSDKLKYGEATAYLDGLGRPLQEVARAANPDGTKDVVQVHVYDAFGREAQQFLPYPVTPNSGYEGRYKANPFTTQASYYNTNYSDKRPYSQIDFEASPLNRPLTAFAPGNSWMGSKGTATEHATHSSYEINVGSEVIQWNIGNNAGDIPVKGSNPDDNNSPYYAAGQLYRNVTTEEHNNRVVEYKDKEGRVVLKKVELPVTSGTPSAIASHAGWICTYYVYDDFGLLRFVIPPKAVEWLNNNNWVFPTGAGGGDVGNELCFRYEYDSRNRIVVKKVPGKGEEWMVYDKRDRLVMTQNANMRNVPIKWLVTQYDELNRPFRTYLWANGDSRITHETNSMSTTTPVAYPDLSGGGVELLTETYYDDYSWVQPIMMNLSGLKKDFVTSQVNTTDFFTPDNSNFPYPQSITPDYNIKGMMAGTKVKILGTADAYLYTVIFYDDWGRVIQTQYRNYGGGIDITTNQYSFDGKLLVSKQKHQPSQNDNALYVISRMTYNHNGQLLKTTKQLTDKWGTQHTQVTISENSYDDLGKLKTKQLGQRKAAPPIVYDAEPQYTNTPVETLDYTYNIRGWLNSINGAYAHPDGHTLADVLAQDDRWFGMELSYDQGFSTNQYNGNISGTVWRSRGDDKQRAYGFAYDATNRLLKADFTQRAGTNTWNTSAGVDYSMYLGNGSDPYTAYDVNGNIKQLYQKGFKPGSNATPSLASQPIDNLTYTYFSNTNKLQQVSDAANDYQSILGDFKYNASAKTSTDYGYDANGNLVFDNNKGMGLGTSSTTDVLGNVTSGGMITYNYLNLPETIDFGQAKGTITYVYDAQGTKLAKTVVDKTGASWNTTSTIYNGNFVYGQPTGNDPLALQYVSHEEGRIRVANKNHVEEIDRFCPPPPVDPSTGLPPTNYCVPFVFFTPYDEYEFDYFLKDHLGNVRAVLTDELDQNNYVAATLEDNVVPSEQPYYSIDPANIVDRQLYNIPDYLNNNGFINPNPQGFSSATSEKVYRLNGSNTATRKGLDIVLKVMSGDKIDIFGKSYHNSISNLQQSPTVQVLDIIMGLLGAPNSAAGAVTHANASAIETMNSATTGPIAMLQGQQNNGSSGLPRASINWLLFNEQFECIGAGTSPILSNPGDVQDHYLPDIQVSKNGYLYVYCSNESPVDVFFDNLQVVHTRGPLLEETHYYPFGLTMAGISSKAAGKTENKYKFNGIEQNTDFDLNTYEAFYRTNDPQLGRWWQIDPKAIEGVSPYASMNNNPLLLSDPLGDTTWIYNQNGVFCGVVNDRMKNQVHYIKTDNDPGKPFDASKLNAKEAKTLAQSFRQTSIAFIGSKTASDMRAIVNQANSLKKELGFVGTIGKDREIRLQALPVGELSGLKRTDMRELDKNYTSAEQNSNLFLEGHTHIAGYLAGFWADDGSDMSNQKGFGEPTNPEDYAPQLDRGSQKGAAPALLLTQWGVTVYGTSTTAPPMGQVNPNNSYLIYKNLKK